jgi:hypothetical protein
MSGCSDYLLSLNSTTTLYNYYHFIIQLSLVAATLRLSSTAVIPRLTSLITVISGLTDFSGGYFQTDFRMQSASYISGRCYSMDLLL